MKDRFLSIYRKNRKLNLNPKETYNHYIKNRDEQEYLQRKLQDIYIFLTDKRLMYAFSCFLVEMGIYKNNRSIYQNVNFLFMQRNILANCKAVEQWKKINYFFDVFIKDSRVNNEIRTEWSRQNTNNNA